MSTAAINPLRNRRRRWATRFLIFLLVSAGLFAAYRHVLGKILAVKLAAIRDTGYPVTLDELDKWYPQAPTSRNSAEVFSVAFTKLRDQAEPALQPRVDLADLAPHAEPLSQAMKQAITSVLASNEEAITLLHEAASLKRSRYPLDLSHLSLLPYPHLINLQRSAYLLALEAVDYADGQNPEMAVRSVRSLLGLADSLAAEPLVRSHLARMECQKEAVASLNSVLSKTALSDSDLSDLSATLGRGDNPQCLARAFAGQRCIGVYGFDMMASSVDLSTLPSGRRRPWFQQLIIELNLLFISPSVLYYPSGMVRWDELRYLWFMDSYIRAAQGEFPERLATARTLQRAVKNLPRLYVFTGQWLRGMNGSKIIVKDAETITRLRAARTATAVERYRLAHGEPPDSLAALTPTYLKTVPADPFDPARAGLRYKKLAKGYVVYSIGQNGQETSGDEKNRLSFVVDR